MSNTRTYFDVHALIHTIYHKIAIWHNNDEKLNDIELGRELKFLSNEIIEDVIKEVFGTNIVLDKERLGMTEQEMKEYNDKIRKYQGDEPEGVDKKKENDS